MPDGIRADENALEPSRLSTARFEQLVRHEQDAVYRGMLRVCRNVADAEDVTADALLQAFQKVSQLRDDASFRAWLQQIGRRLCWRLRRRQDLFTVMPDLPIAAAGPTPEEQASMQQLHAAVEQMLRDMPPLLSQAYILTELEEIPGPEAAQRLEISLPALKARLRRARHFVRERMKEEIWK
jgi:RNA polymerase sigma-70 factor, ECF subfamily